MAPRPALFGLVVYFLVLGWMSWRVVEAVAVDPMQRDILFKLRSEMPLLSTVQSNPWTDVAINGACDATVLYGVSACNGTGWVTQIFLSGQPVGQLGDSIGDMAGLTFFSASFNALSGTLPGSIGNLSRLGQIQLILNPSLTGPIPNEWKSLKSLSTFIWQVSDTPQQVPDWIGDEWTALTRFEWKRLQTHQSFPSWIASHPRLNRVVLDGNQFEGPIPEALASHPTLVELQLQNNAFSGSLPSDWSGAPKLTNIYLHNNQFSGPLPTALGPKVKSVWFGYNRFTGSIHQSWMDKPGLNEIDVVNNQLMGPLRWPSNHSSSVLSMINLSRNPMIGASIPSSFFQLPFLDSFFADDTGIEGPLPINVPANCALRRLSLNNVSLLGGSIPRLDYCANIQLISMSNCSIGGGGGGGGHDVGSIISNFTSKLKTLNLANNDIASVMPNDWSSLTSLSLLDLSGNRFSGSVSQSLTKLTIQNDLSQLFLNNNHLNLCADSTMTNDSISNTITCNVSSQTPHECGCVGVWTHCLNQEMPETCPPPSSEAPVVSPSPGSASPSSVSPYGSPPSSSPSFGSPTQNSSPSNDAISKTASFGVVMLSSIICLLFIF